MSMTVSLAATQMAAQLEAQSQVVAAKELIADVEEDLGGFEAVVSELRQRMDEQYAEAMQRIDDLQRQVETTSAEFQATIDGVTARIANARSALEARVPVLTHEYASVAQALEDLEDLTRQSHAAFDTKLEALPQKLAQLRTHTAAALASLVAEGSEFREAVAAAARTSDEQIAELAASGEALLAEAETRFQTSDGKTAEITDACGQQANGVNDATVNASSAVGRSITGTAKAGSQLFGGHADEARGSMVALAGHVAQLQSEYDRRVQKVVGGASEVLALVRQIRPVLELVRKLA